LPPHTGGGNNAGNAGGVVLKKLEKVKWKV
jgi:hypothetical protein